MSNIAYEFRNISKSDKLKNINFTIEKNKSIAFIIENDDKRNLFSNIVTGLESPDEGEIFINDKQPYFDGYPFQELGVLLNDPSFINTHDGFKNLKMLSEYERNIENIEIKC